MTKQTGFGFLSKQMSSFHFICRLCLQPERNITSRKLVLKAHSWHLLAFLLFKRWCSKSVDFAGDAVVKNPPTKAGDTREVGLIPESARSPGGGNSNLLRYFCLENSMDRGTWRATIYEVTKSWTWLSTYNTVVSQQEDFLMLFPLGDTIFFSFPACIWS